MRKTKIIALILAVVMLSYALPVAAFVAYTPADTSKYAATKTAINDAGGYVFAPEDFETPANTAQAATVVDGSSGNCCFTLYDGENGALGTKVTNNSTNSVVNKTNSQRQVDDGTHGKAIKS